MNIMIYNIAAESGGAITILNEFYNESKNDKDNNYIFVLSKPCFEETHNIKFLNFPWIKKSWIHRLFFDNFVAPRLVNDYNIDKILSLQNIIIPHTNVYQEVYIHNAIPFSEYKFKIYESFHLWIYQNLIGKKICESIKRADKVILQNKWMKDKCIQKTNTADEKFVIKFPKADLLQGYTYNNLKKRKVSFFYPANGALFKNHDVIIKACNILKEKNVVDYEVIFTLEATDSKRISRMKKMIDKENLPISLVGSLSRNDVYNYYTNSTLVFPSYLETIGLPLLEAKYCNTPIIVADCMYAHEVLSDYQNVEFFPAMNERELSFLMLNIINTNNQKG